MIIVDVIQGSPEWHKERAGVPTASLFDKIITTKGIPSKSAEKYMYQLAAERITGVREDTFQSAAMARGIEMESEARAMYEFRTGNDVEEVGFCYYDKRKLYGCSPDGLVGKDGLLEIKCPTSAVHVGYLLSGTFPMDYFQQVQGQLRVTDRKWCDFFSFYPGLPPLLVRVIPDMEFIVCLGAALDIFCQDLKDTTEKLRRV